MQDELKQDILNNNISHAYLLLGEKTSVFHQAKEFALTLNCKNPKDAGACACHTCRPCLLGQEGSFCDFTTIEPDGATYKIKQIRDLLKTLELAPQEGIYRIFLLQDIDKMQDVTANAILKSLEEPLPQRIFLLLAENRDKILPTIESRCRIIQEKKEEAPLNQELLNEAYNLLVSLPTLSFHDIFKLGEKYTTKNKDTLKSLLLAAEEIFSINIKYCWEESEERKHLFYHIPLGEKELLQLWEKATTALMYLEYQGTPRLIAENFFIAVRKKNGGIQ